MADYRIYILDIEGKVGVGTDCDCENDGHARRTAQAMLLGTQEAEVWLGARKVGRVSALIK